MNKTPEPATLGEKILAFFICTTIVAFGIFACYSMKMLNEENIAKDFRIAEYKINHNCYVNGFAGRYAEIRVYSCDTGIKLEKDMK